MFDSDFLNQITEQGSCLANALFAGLRLDIVWIMSFSLPPSIPSLRFVLGLARYYGAYKIQINGTKIEIAIRTRLA